MKRESESVLRKQHDIPGFKVFTRFHGGRWITRIHQSISCANLAQVIYGGWSLISVTRGGDNLLFLDCDKSSPRIRNTHDNYILPCIGCMILWLPRFISVGISFSAEKYPDGKLVLILKSSAQYRG